MPHAGVAHIPARVLLAHLIPLAVIVEGDVTCPAPAQVSAVLETLLAADAGDGEPHRAHLRASSDKVDVELHAGVGRVLARKTFAREGSCNDLAAAIAVVIATWEAELAGATPALQVSARPSTTSVSDDDPPPHSAPSATVGRPKLIVGGGVLVTGDEAGWALGGVGEVSLAPASQRVALRVAAIATSRRRDELAPGAVTWHRQALALGGRVQVLSRGVRLAAVGDVVFGLLSAKGEGFTENRTVYSFDPGLAGGARMTVPLRGLDVFVEATETWWARTGHLQVSGTDAMKELPHSEHHVVVGLVGRLKDF